MATAENLKGRFAQTLRRCFQDDKIVDDYLDNVPPFPNTLPEQRRWVDSQCSKLREIINEQKKGLSDYVQNDGSMPS